MKQLIDKVKEVSLAAKRSSCQRTFLDSTMTDPSCHKVVTRMNSITKEQLGAACGATCPYHFQGPLNRVTIDGLDSEDYRLVLFFIKKGTRMPLHDHPNMSVFFRLVFGQLSYRAYDKVDQKFKYNNFVEDEYQELLENKRRIKAKRSKLMTLRTDDLLFVRPSTNNMHEFVAEENSCFFDICLPNYTPHNSSRRITYFKEIGSDQGQQPLVRTGVSELDLPSATAGPAQVMRGGLTELEYYTTPPEMPVGFQVNDLDYRGCYQ